MNSTIHCVRQVTFSDFNEDVLVGVTRPNVLMNVEGSRRFGATYVAGDWNTLGAVVGAGGAGLGAGEGAGKGGDQASAAAAAAAAGATALESEASGGEEADKEGGESAGGSASAANANGGGGGGGGGCFDLILTAETCYTERACRDVARLLHGLLAPGPRALALVATKRFYFGTGGSAVRAQ